MAKTEAQVTQEIQAIIRQITASVTFLPLLSDACACGGGGGGLSGSVIISSQARATGEALAPRAAPAGSIDLLAYTDKESEVPFEW